MFNLSPLKLYASLGAIIFVVVVLGLHLYRDNALEKRCLKAEGALSAQKAIAKAAEGKYKADLKAAQADSAKAAATGNAERSAILNTWQTVIQKGKTQNETTKTKLATTVAQLEQLRRAVYDSASTLPSGSESDRPTERGSDAAVSGRELETCKAAGAVAASQYKELYARCESNCRLTGCN